MNTLENSFPASIEMPRYQCHKKVHALKIGKLEIRQGQLWLEPEDARYAAFPLERDWVQKHQPQEGGYYVVYSDGYKSYSTAKAFEEGYTRI